MTKKSKNSERSSTAKASTSSAVFGLTPKEIVSELNRYIIGQNDAKKAVAIALRNRYRRKMV